MESHNVVVRGQSSTTGLITDSAWSPVENLCDEARIVLHQLSNAHKNKTKPTSVSTPSSELVSTTDANIKSHHSSTVPEGKRSTPSSKLVGTASSVTSSSPAPVIPSQPENNPELIAMLKEASKSDYLGDLMPVLRAFLKVEDTGGQPELMDMLPALTIGRGLYLLFFNCQCNLQEKYTVSHCSRSGQSTPKVESTYSASEMLLSQLSSISCSNTSISYVSSEHITNPELKKLLQPSKSIAYIVGTHRDMVSEEVMAQFDRQLQDIIRLTAFFKDDIVKYWKPDQLAIPLDNMSGGAQEIKDVRKELEKALEHFGKLSIPAAWLMVSVCLRIRSKKTSTLDSCMQLSKHFDMDAEETKVALWFLHHCAGVLMHFPNVPELKDLVIMDPQVVYDSVTKLILRATEFDEVGKAVSDRFIKRGQFTFEVLEKGYAKIVGQDGDCLTPVQLMALLKNLYITARFLVEGEEIFILPCVLHSATNEELDSFQADACHPSIMIRYKCGAVPNGVFIAIIACLIGDSPLTFIPKGIRKNKVQFRHGRDRSLVTIMLRPTYYEVHVERSATAETPLHEECVAIRRIMESSCETVSSHMNYGCYLEYQFSFECPSHPGREHLCVVERSEASPRCMDCLCDVDDPVPIPLQDHHKVWYGQVIA